jgi:pimeloyl-ACP methyl ester carboxylesterase/DNA-binding CsgD family transcriptional regulator
MIPETRYANADGVKIAYQAFGEGPVDIVLVPGFVSHVEIAWEDPFLARFLTKLSTFTRVLFFDKRGTGLSDRSPLDEFLSLERRADDIRAVMDDVGSDRAAIYAWSEGGPASLTFASKYPDRILALVLAGTTAKFGAEPGYTGIEQWLLDAFVEACEEDWGNGVFFEFFAPSLRDDERCRRWWARYQRNCVSPGAVAASLRRHIEFDGRALLPELRVPTLVLHHKEDLIVPLECGRYLADHIPGAILRELDGSDHMYWVGDQDVLLGHLRAFLEGLPGGAALRRHKAKRHKAGFGWESLSESENAIVALVEAGLTNREIASRLHLSVKTVESHIHHVFDKLGVDSRARLAAEAARAERAAT